MKHGNLKSNEAILANLVVSNVRDVYASLSSHFGGIKRHDIDRDIDYIQRRISNEGLNFLTKRLPELGDFFDKLVRGQEVQRVAGFAPYDGLYPCFLRPIWHWLCQGEIGPDTVATIRIVRSLLLGYKKLEFQLTEAMRQEALEKWKSIEYELEALHIIPSTVTYGAQSLLDRVFPEGRFLTAHMTRHGPGAVAGGERHEDKWVPTQLFRDVHEVWNLWEHLFPVTESLIPDLGRAQRTQLAASIHRYRNGDMTWSDCATSRLLFVPKDSRGPRTISCEPKELMWIQQGVLDSLLRFIGQSELTRGRINFLDQSINGLIALKSSLTRAYATIDLSDASDRVSCQLVNMLFPKHISRQLMGTRSAKVLLPNGETHQLQKFAPMGSAICFPVESLVFWAIAASVVTKYEPDGTPDVYIYGDDIIIPDKYASEVMDALESVGLKVNREKSFHGEVPFRESCGVDALCGYLITPYRVKLLPPTRPYHASSVAAYLDYSSNCWQLMPHTGRYLHSIASEAVGRVIPLTYLPQAYASVVVPPNDAWTDADYSRHGYKLRWNDSTQNIEIKAHQIRAKTRPSNLDSWPGLLQSLVEPATERARGYVVGSQPTQIRYRWTNTFAGWCTDAQPNTGSST